MTLLEAIKSGKPFKLPKHTSYSTLNGCSLQFIDTKIDYWLSRRDFESVDWEIKDDDSRSN